MRSASSTMRSISSWDNRPLSFLIVIFCSLPVDFSTAETLRMPLASISKVTSICGWPRGIGGMPSRLNLPSRLLSFVMERSPSKTWMSTPGWLSAYVEKVCDFFAGTVVLRLIKAVITPPAVSRPADEDDLVDLGLGQLRVPHDLLDGVHALAEVVHVQVLEARARDRAVEVDALKQRVDLEVRLGGRRQRALGSFTRST